MKSRNQHTLVSVALLMTLIALLGMSPVMAADDAPSGVVNINQASKSELALLPRVGPALAERIIAYRDENGRFEQAEDLILVRGIGEKTFALMEGYVVTQGETTLTEKVRATASPTSSTSIEQDGR